MSGKAQGQPAEVSGQAGEVKDEDHLMKLWGVGQSAIWLIGIFVLAWQDWWWPGIMVLVAISGISAGVVGYFTDKRKSQVRAQAMQVKAQAEQVEVEKSRAETLPDRCPACGGPISPTSVTWRSATTATCPYCNSSIKALKPTS